MLLFRFIYLFVYYTVIHWLVHSWQSFACWLPPSFIHSFIPSFIHLLGIFLLFLTQVPPVGIILLVDLVLAVSRVFWSRSFTLQWHQAVLLWLNGLFLHLQIACFIVVFSLIQQIKENEELKSELPMDSPVILLNSHERLSSPEQYLWLFCWHGNTRLQSNNACDLPRKY